MIKKRNAIRIIETWWEQILEERKRKELEAQIKKMPKDCQKLYRQFIRLGKQTKNIKILLIKIKKKKKKIIMKKTKKKITLRKN